MPQVRWLELNGKVKLDYIGKFENLNANFNTVLRKNKLKKPHSKERVKFTISPIIKNFIQKNQEIIRLLYREDIKSLNMSFKCKVCGQEFETERKLHSHLKKHDLRVAAYYQQYYPRHDLYDGKIIKFKSKDYYFNTDFNTRTNQLKWLNGLSNSEAKEYLKKLLVERKERKGLIYSPVR